MINNECIHAQVCSVLSSAIISNIYQNEMAQLKGSGYVHTRQALFKGRKLIAGSGVTLSVLSFPLSVLGLSKLVSAMGDYCHSLWCVCLC